MLKNHIKLAFRHMVKQWPITIINLGGLSLAIGITILILLFVQDQFSYNKFNEKRDRIYLVQLGTTEHMPSAIGIDLSENIKDIEQMVRFTVWGSGLVEYPLSGENSNAYILENPVFTDSTLFDIFTFQFLSGNPETALDLPFSVVLTKDIADMIFPGMNPMGEVIKVENSFEYTVTGIIDNVSNFHIPIDAICSFSSLTKIYGPEFNYRYDDGWQHPTYVLLPEKHNTSQIEEDIEDFYKERGIFEDPDFQLNSLNKIYFTSRVGKKGNLQFVYLLLVVGILIILVAALNYINLTTAGSGQRSMEIGIKKVIGGDRVTLIMQYLTESVLLTLVALILGFVIAELLIPLFNNLIVSNLVVKEFYRLPVILYVVFAAVALGLLSGLYPAYNLISVHPAQVIKGERTKGKKGAILRRFLIIFQFTVSIMLLTGMFTVYKQLSYMKSKDLGFIKEKTIILDPVRALEGSKLTFKDQILSIPQVQSVSFSNAAPGGNFWYWSVSSNEIDASVRVNAIDPDFISMYGLQIIDGRDFNWDQTTDMDNKFIINETAARLFELDDPILKKLTGGPNGDGEIIGVIEDFHFISLHHEIQPLVLYWLDWPHRIINVRVSGGKMDNVLHNIEEKWNEFSANYPFSYSLLEDSFDLQYRSEDQLMKAFGYFTLLALVIACSGLFGLTLFLVEQKTREIAIRKSFGATVRAITFSFTYEMVALIGISIVLAVPVSWRYLKNWMYNFPFKTELSWWLFVIPGIFAVILAVLTISTLTYKAANRNPADSLRYE